MITGDMRETAEAIARQLDFFDPRIHRSLSGAEVRWWIGTGLLLDLFIRYRLAQPAIGSRCDLLPFLLAFPASH